MNTITHFESIDDLVLNCILSFLKPLEYIHICKRFREQYDISKSDNIIRFKSVNCTVTYNDIIKYSKYTNYNLYVNEHGANKVFDHLPIINHIYLMNNKYRNSNMQIVNMPFKVLNIISLTINSTSMNTVKNEHLIKFENLKHLYLIGMNLKITHKAFQHLHKLKTLSFSDTIYSDLTPFFTSNLKLESIELFYMRYLTKLPFIHNSQNLKHLIIKGCYKLHLDYEHIMCYSNIESLEIHYNPFLNSSNINHIFKNLKHLTILSDTFIKDSDINNIRQLVSLNLYQTDISDNGVYSLINLTHFTPNENMTNCAIYNLINITYLDLSHCSNITDFYHLTNLSTLKIYRHMKKFKFYKLKHLKKLDVSNNKHIQNSDIKSLIQLNELDISNTNITDKYLCNFINLQHIDITNNFNITINSIRHLKKLKSIHLNQIAHENIIQNCNSNLNIYILQ